MATRDLYKNEAYLNAVSLSKQNIGNPYLVGFYVFTLKIIGMWSIIKIVTDLN